MYTRTSRINLLCLILTLVILQVRHAAANEGSKINRTGINNELSDSADVYSPENENTRMILSEQFGNYLLIKNSLSDNDSISAQLHASQFLENLLSMSDKIGKSNLSRNWELFLRFAPEAQKRIASSNSLSEQRFFFGIVSNFIIDLIKDNGIENYTIHILQCSDKSILGAGKWLSDVNDGKNPFLGPGNESCIEVIGSKTSE